MLVFGILAEQQTSSCASRDAHKLDVKRMPQPFGGGVLVMKGKAQQFGYRWQLVVVQLDDVCLLRGIGKNLGGVKRLPKVDVEDPGSLRPNGLQKGMNGLAGARTPLRQGTKAYRVSSPRQGLPPGSPFERIPGDWLRNLKCRLPFRIDLDLDNPGAIGGILLNPGRAETKALQLMFGCSPEIIAADAARYDALIAEQARHISEIRWRAAQLAALRENIPEQFSQSDRRELFHG